MTATTEAPATVTLAPTTVWKMHAAVRAATARATTEPSTLQYARLTLSPSSAAIVASDRYRIHGWRCDAEATRAAVGLVEPADLAVVVADLASASVRREDRESITLTIDEREQTMTWASALGSITTSWEVDAAEYPRVERVLYMDECDRPAPSSALVAPAFIVEALQAADRVSGRLDRDYNGSVVEFHANADGEAVHAVIESTQFRALVITRRAVYPFVKKNTSTSKENPNG